MLPFLSLQIMDFLLCLLTLLGSYIELPAYLKFASRSSRVVSTQPCPMPPSWPAWGGGGGSVPWGPSLVDEPEPHQITPAFFLCEMCPRGLAIPACWGHSVRKVCTGWSARCGHSAHISHA